MAAYNKFNAWVDYLAEGVNAATDTFKVAFTATANAPTASNAVLTDLTTVVTTNLNTTTLVTASSSQTSGTYALKFNNLTMTATGGSVGPFQYVVIYDDTVAGKPLVCWFDYGSALTLNLNDTFTLTFDSAGLFTVGP